MAPTFIPYQVDYTVQNTAKTLGFSKKRVTFKFGFANEKAIAEGNNGPACRGSEHELTFVWSLKTGKRQLLLDNRDLHFSESGQNGWFADTVWQHSFSLKDKATHKVFKVHFISQPKDRDLSSQRPFDLRIGGMSYFQFNKIFQLGTPRMIVGQADTRGHGAGGGGYHESGRDSPMNAEERKQLAAAKLASLRDIEEERVKREEEEQQKQSKQQDMQRVEEALISFDDDPPPPVPAQVPATQLTSSGGPNQYYASSITMDNFDGGAANPYAPPPPAPTSGGYGSNNPYGGTSNPYGAAATTNPYGASPYGTASPYGASPYGASPPPAPAPPAAADSSNSFALTPYQPPASSGGGGGQQQQQQQPYVDATGRVSYGAGGSSANSGTAASSSYNNNSYGGQNMASPSNQTYMSYGSAPSFAQPQQQQQQYQQSPNSFAQQPPQYSSGYPPQAPQQQQQPPRYPAPYSY